MSQDFSDDSGFGDEGKDAELAATVADQRVGDEIMEETEVKGRDANLAAYEVVLVTADKKDAEARCLPTETSSKTTEQCS